MGQYTDRARELRPIIEDAGNLLPDDEALEAMELFPFWSADGVVYKANDKVRYMDLLWKCLQDHTSQADWAPNLAVSLWVRVDNPGEEWPEWVQPVGAHDAYAKGYKVSHNDKHWISDVDANVWEPGVTMWTEAE
jgi:hypothetical protein